MSESANCEEQREEPTELEEAGGAEVRTFQMLAVVSRRQAITPFKELSLKSHSPKLPAPILLTPSQ